MARNSFLSAGCGLLLCVLPAESWAQSQKAPQTHPTLKFLMATPLTLLDKGVFEMIRRLESANSNPYWIDKKPPFLKDEAIHPNVYVRPNAFIVTVHMYPDRMDDGRRAQACTQLVRFAETVLGFQEANRYMTESLQSYFSHYQYAPAGFPSDLGAKIKRIFWIQGGVVANNGKTFCHSKSGGEIANGDLSALILD